MSMKSNELRELIGELSEGAYLKAEQIPNLSLYIDQILTLFSEGSPEEQSLTKSMVNNYSKEKMLRPIKGKKYSREQILQILLICRLKTTLNMEQIKAVTAALMEEEDGEAALEQILNRADEQKPFCAEIAEKFAEQLTAEHPAELILELCQLSNLLANTARILAEQNFSGK